MSTDTQNGKLRTILLIIVYAVILIFVPIFLDALFTLTIRRNRIEKIKKLAQNDAQTNDKSVVTFYSPNKGRVRHPNSPADEEFDGDMIEILSSMSDNCCVIVVIETLEYLPDPNEAVKHLLRVSGNRLYIVGFERNSPRAFWDYRIRQLLQRPYYTPESLSLIALYPLNTLQKTAQQFYEHIFQIVPYNWFSPSNI